MLLRFRYRLPVTARLDSKGALCITPQRGVTAPQNLTDIIALGVGEYLEDERFKATLSDGIHEEPYSEAHRMVGRIQQAVFTFAEYATGGKSDLPTNPSPDDIYEARAAQLPQWKRHFTQGLENLGLAPNGAIEEY